MMGFSVIQTAEGATNEVADIIKRMRELTIQSSSETLANSERAYIQDEYDQLADEVNRIAAVTNFNGVNLANGDQATLDVQVSEHAPPMTGLQFPWRPSGHHFGCGYRQYWSIQCSVCSSVAYSIGYGAEFNQQHAV